MRPASALHYYTTLLCPRHDVCQHISLTFNYCNRSSMVHKVDSAGFGGMLALLYTRTAACMLKELLAVMVAPLSRHFQWLCCMIVLSSQGS